MDATFEGKFGSNVESEFDGGTRHHPLSPPFGPPELRDGPLPAPDLPEGSDGEDGVVADSRSGYVLRWGRRPKQLPLVPGKPTRGTVCHVRR